MTKTNSIALYIVEPSKLKINIEIIKIYIDIASNIIYNEYWILPIKAKLKTNSKGGKCRWLVEEKRRW